MCLSSQIKKIQAQKEALDAKIRKLEELESKTEPIKQALYQLFEDYRVNAPDELRSILQEIQTTCSAYYLPTMSEIELNASPMEIAKLHVPEASTEIDSVGMGGFQSIQEYEIATGQTDEAPVFTHREKYELYTGNEPSSSENFQNFADHPVPPESGELKIGDRLSNGSEFATVSVIMKKEVYLNRDSGGSVCLSISEVEDFGWKSENQLPEPTDEQIEGKLDLGDEGDVPDQTELQDLLEVKDHFVFGELHLGVKIKSVFVKVEIDYEGTDEGGDPVTEEIEHALFEVSDFNGQSRDYYKDCESLFYKYQGFAELEKAALEYAKNFSRELKEEKKIAEILAKATETEQDKASEPAKSETETEFEAMGYRVKVYPQLPMGVTFRFLNADETVAFASSLTTPEIGDRTWQICAWDLISTYREREANRGKQDPSMVAATIDPNKAFVELVKISNEVAYLKRKDNGEMLAGYAAFSNKTMNGDRAKSSAKPRAEKWAAHLTASLNLTCEVRKSKRIISEISVMPFAYEIKIKDCSTYQLQKLAEEDLALLPNELPTPTVTASAKLEETSAPKVYTCKVNSYIVVSGAEEEARNRFELELLLLGGPTGNHKVSLLAGSDVAEAFNMVDFQFTKDADFDEINSEYSVSHPPTSTQFTVWVTAGTRKWRHSHAIPGDGKFFNTKEAAAVDAVRTILAKQKK